MILYHYTDEESARSILKEGLTQGIIYSDLLGKAIQPIQWLTKETSSPKYCVKSYRNVRLIVHVDKSDEKLLDYKKWLKVVEKLNSADAMRIYTLPGCRKWFIYIGEIPPEWIERG